MFKRHSTGVVSTAALAGILAAVTMPAQAQVTIILKKSPHPIVSQPYSNPYPYPGSVYIPGTVTTVPPVLPLVNSSQPAILPVAVPRPYYSTNGTIVNSTLINPTVVNSTIVNSTLVNPTLINSSVVGYPTVVTTVPGYTQGLPAGAVAVLQTHNLANGYSYYTLSNNGGTTLYVNVNAQPWLTLGSGAKYQVLQGIGSLYAAQGFSLVIQSGDQQVLGKYVCQAQNICNPVILY
ncbi:hypothetical protein BST81_18950 [Leptolyngbya sp. 'hensonii']|uniref:hypothetical protein n=1 Tax=Leptolyngbya sp. 'hensonii' TaxID=1922337 RepID=UPI00094FF381|nr:hypothetical protein [Leptolyngbya sp. 'hensonii']OLP16776.1 hypothetical protein BST81_18950 [Leptolyngbya sp. 'hensonii']